MDLGSKIKDLGPKNKDLDLQVKDLGPKICAKASKPRKIPRIPVFPKALRFR